MTPTVAPLPLMLAAVTMLVLAVAGPSLRKPPSIGDDDRPSRLPDCRPWCWGRGARRPDALPLTKDAGIAGWCRQVKPVRRWRRCSWTGIVRQGLIGPRMPRRRARRCRHWTAWMLLSNTSCRSDCLRDRSSVVPRAPLDSLLRRHGDGAAEADIAVDRGALARDEGGGRRRPAQ